MAKKCNYKKWIIIGLLIVATFFLFNSFSTMKNVEGFDNKPDPCNKYTDCKECSSANVGGSNPNSYGGNCGWCKQTGTCMSTEQNFYMINQDRCKCSTDTKDCNIVGCNNITPDSNDTHPILKWYLILKKRMTNTTDPSTTDPSTTDPSTTDPSTTDPSTTDPSTTTV